MTESVFKKDWAVTDNTTLHDAAYFFMDISPKNLHQKKHYFYNWLSFLEGVVLHGKLVADHTVFNNQLSIKRLKEGLGDCIGYFDLGETRNEFKAQARELCHNNKKTPLDNNEWSDLHRCLFYSSVASKNNITYRPAISRENAFTNTYNKPILNPNRKPDVYAAVAKNILQNVEIAAQDYTKKLNDLSGVKFISAQLPPLALMVIREAHKCGNWAEAIYNLRESKAASNFRTWLREVVDCLIEGDLRAGKDLEKANEFILGWVKDPDERVKYITRKVKVGDFTNVINISLEYNIKDPILTGNKNLIFLSKLYKEKIKTKEIENLRNIPLRK